MQILKSRSLLFVFSHYGNKPDAAFPWQWLLPPSSMDQLNTCLCQISLTGHQFEFHLDSLRESSPPVHIIYQHLSQKTITRMKRLVRNTSCILAQLFLRNNYWNRFASGSISPDCRLPG